MKPVAGSIYFLPDDRCQEQSDQAGAALLVGAPKTIGVAHCQMANRRRHYKEKHL